MNLLGFARNELHLIMRLAVPSSEPHLSTALLLRSAACCHADASRARDALAGPLT